MTLNPRIVKQLLADAGCPDNSILFSLGACGHETGKYLTFDSPVEEADFNLTGIEWLNEAWQVGATQGIQMPTRDTGGVPAWYAKFDSLESWAKDYKRIIHRLPAQNTKGRPIDATTVEDYVHRLKLNSYFGGDETAYLNGTKAAMAAQAEWFADNPQTDLLAGGAETPTDDQA